MTRPGSAATADIADHADASAAADPAVAARARRTIIAIVGMLCYQGFTMAINAIGSPWIAKSFGLDQSGIAGLYACISVSAIGALILSRLVDRVGRRRVLIWCMTATPLSALGAALSSSIYVFIAFEILLYAFIGATVAGSVVMLAEELPIAQRARGQSYGGLAIGLGGGLCVVLMPLLANAGYSWRWLLGLSATGMLALPWMVPIIPESQRWERAAASGTTKGSRFYDPFGPRYRGRAIPILVCGLLFTVVLNAATSWSYFHAVSVVGLSAGTASVMTLIGGALGIMGFPLGAWACERFGRVPTAAGSGLLATAGCLCFYWGPPGFAGPALWLGATFAWFSGALNAAQVGGNSAATELFPTALRGTMFGWFALIGAIASVSAQGTIALLAEPLGGLSNVVGYLALLEVPSAIIFALFIEETRGLSLEVAAKEH